MKTSINWLETIINKVQYMYVCVKNWVFQPNFKNSIKKIGYAPYFFSSLKMCMHIYLLGCVLVHVGKWTPVLEYDHADDFFSVFVVKGKLSWHSCSIRFSWDLLLCI